ncbi:MAG: hypothetical protein KGS72_24175 [Cyanobacteria bacterium REEB67]|nr:hypothetical protein [Cyanobacteria bacterium REEB67]
MKKTATLSALGLIACVSLNGLPVFADAAADAAKEQAEAQADSNKAREQAAKGHPLRAGRAAKKAKKAQEKAEKDMAKEQQGK